MILILQYIVKEVISCVQSRISRFIASTEEVLRPQERREWDSNPRALADKRFSRPPRYDHFDISPSDPSSLTARIILTKRFASVNSFFHFFSFFFFYFRFSLILRHFLPELFSSEQQLNTLQNQISINSTQFF